MLVVLFAAGGGSNGLFTLDPSSPSLQSCPTYSPADIFVDDAERIPPGGQAPPCSLTVDLPASGLGLPRSANVDALSCGLESLQTIIGRLPLIPFSNPMDTTRMIVPNFTTLIYQFSVGRLARKSEERRINLPHNLVENPVLIVQTEEFTSQFAANDQAADVFTNFELLQPVVGPPARLAPVGRVNFLAVNQHAFKLTGNPPASPALIDNIDGIMSLGSCQVTSLDANRDGLPDVPIYFSVDAETARLLGVRPGDVLVKPPGAAPLEVYASAAELGLEPEDDIDALAVLDAQQDRVFNAGDAVVFSLRAGSPSLPIAIDEIEIDEGGLFLSLPGQPLLTGLPGAYLSLGPRNELDGILLADPGVLPFDALTFTWLPPPPAPPAFGIRRAAGAYR